MKNIKHDANAKTSNSESEVTKTHNPQNMRRNIFTSNQTYVNLSTNKTTLLFNSMQEQLVKHTSVAISIN
ncbi:hypothetical protein QVD17_04393 [Tagetes erecta]|uniref:Uncharacterized protein n=1 Tax=Tagetes erecta TaxID=13708 RepID=A0AAD8LA22_TARER|nr:hypothetical protein QVD17_04393 [Tagetes erecta]